MNNGAANRFVADDTAAGKRMQTHPPTGHGALARLGGDTRRVSHKRSRIGRKHRGALGNCSYGAKARRGRAAGTDKHFCFRPASFDRLNIENLADVATMTPGVDFLLNGPESRLTIRGIFTNGGAATTAILIDDVPVQLRIHFSTMFRSKLRNSTAEPIRSVRLPLASEQYIDGSESA